MCGGIDHLTGEQPQHIVRVIVSYVPLEQTWARISYRILAPEPGVPPVGSAASSGDNVAPPSSAAAAPANRSGAAPGDAVAGGGGKFALCSGRCGGAEGQFGAPSAPNSGDGPTGCGSIMSPSNAWKSRAQLAAEVSGGTRRPPTRRQPPLGCLPSCPRAPNGSPGPVWARRQRPAAGVRPSRAAAPEQRSRKIARSNSVWWMRIQWDGRASGQFGAPSAPSGGCVAPPYTRA